MRTAAKWVILLFALALPGCWDGPDTSKLIEELQAQIKKDQEALRIDAETRDPARTNLKARFVDTSVMGIRPTTNPDRPFVGFVRIQWHFDYTDGRNLGDAVFDYIYARTPDARWIKADEAEIPPDALKDRPASPAAPLPAESPAGRKPA